MRTIATVKSDIPYEAEQVGTFHDESYTELFSHLSFVKQIFLDNHYGIAIYDCKGFTLLKANSKYMEMVGISESAIGLKLKDFIPEFEGSESEKRWKGIVKTGETVYLEEFEGALGGMKGKYWECTLTPAKTDGEVRLIVAMLVDVTERVISKQLEEKSRIIEQQKDLLEAVLESMNDVIIVYDKFGKPIVVNAEARKLYSEDISKTVAEIQSEYQILDLEGNEVRIDDILLNKRLRDGKIRNKKIVVKKNGTDLILEVNATPVLDKKGELISIVISNHDITRDFETQKTLQEQNELLLQQADILIRTKDRLSVALESVDAGIWEWDIITNNQVWAPKVYELYGIDQLEPVPLEKGMNSVYPEDKAGIEYSLEETLKSRNKFWRKEFRIVNPQRGIVWLKGTGKVFYDTKGNPIKMIGVNIDITEQKEQEKLLLQAEHEKNEALENVIQMKDEFLYLITHEFKTPLTVIGSALQAMDLLYADQVPLGLPRYLNIIKQNANRQLRLVNNLLDITRVNAGKIKLNSNVFDIVYLVQTIVDSIQCFAQQKGVKVFFDTKIASKQILIDEEKLERILLNLLSNALKFTPQGRSITVVLNSKKINYRSMVCISVQDEGIGIPKDKQEYIFERFGQADTSLSRQAEGTGIGLYLVKLFVDAMGGYITLESKEGKGSIFTVMLPVIKATPMEEITACSETSGQLMHRDNRLVQAVNIEFSDIYF